MIVSCPVRSCLVVKENVIKGVDKWWANGNIICNEHQRPREANSQVWWYGIVR